jgi:alkylresorcinol/alkylpyrone synthase
MVSQCVRRALGELASANLSGSEAASVRHAFCLADSSPSPMAFITHVGTAVPRHAIEQDAVAGVVARTFGLDAERTASVRGLFDRARVRRRHSVVPLEQVGDPRSLSESMPLYRRHGLELALSAASSCLEQASLAARDIDFIITSSCTGVSLPSLATLLVGPLGLRSDVRRLPLTELGCAGGASALAHAHAHLRAFPEARVLVVAVELPSLTFRGDDPSPENLVASALFGDGAAAVLLQGSAAKTGVEILATHTGLLPASLDDMGFDLRDSGFYVVLSKNVPRIIADATPPVVRQFLERHQLSLEELEFFVLHPGGRRVLEALEHSLALKPAHTAASWNVLADYGNQSSASVLFVLRETLGRGVPRGYGLLAAFGPGITVELALLRGLPC